MAGEPVKRDKNGRHYDTRRNGTWENSGNERTISYDDERSFRTKILRTSSKGKVPRRNLESEWGRRKSFFTEFEKVVLILLFRLFFPFFDATSPF